MINNYLKKNNNEKNLNCMKFNFSNKKKMSFKFYQ